MSKAHSEEDGTMSCMFQEDLKNKTENLAIEEDEVQTEFYRKARKSLQYPYKLSMAATGLLVKFMYCLPTLYYNSSSNHSFNGFTKIYCESDGEYQLPINGQSFVREIYDVIIPSLFDPIDMVETKETIDETTIKEYMVLHGKGRLLDESMPLTYWILAEAGLPVEKKRGRRKKENKYSVNQRVVFLLYCYCKYVLKKNMKHTIELDRTEEHSENFKRQYNLLFQDSIDELPLIDQQ